MMQKLLKWLSWIIVFVLAGLFLIKFGGPRILTAYIETGLGNCSSIPILCRVPEEDALTFEIDKNYLQLCFPYKFPKAEICAPKEF